MNAMADGFERFQDSDWSADADHRVISDQLPAGDWQVDPSGSMVNIRGRTFFRTLPVNGFFEHFSGGLRADADGQVSGRLKLESASLQTGIDRRDEQLRSAEVLNAASYPEIEFRLSELTTMTRQVERIVAESQMSAHGVLALIGAEVPLEFPVTVIEHGDHLHIEARIKFDLQTAGLKPRQPGLIGRMVRVDTALTLRRAS